MSQFRPLFLFLLLISMKGWATAASAKAKPLRIGVPANSPCPKYVNVRCNNTSNSTCFQGFSIEVFQLILKRIRYLSHYEFIPYEGSYDDLIKQVYFKQFDAVVGDTSIVADRCRYVDFSRHYTEMGVRMVVLEEKAGGKAWIFVKPFTKMMWAATGAIFLYNGLIVWLMERAGNEESKGSFCNQIGNWIWLTFTTLFPIHGEKLRSNLSKMTMVVWLFVALVLTQSYTASLSSLLTIERLKPSVLDVETLKKTKATVGCDSGSFVGNYLENVLGFDKKLIKTYESGNDYASAIKTGAIKAAFLELAYIKVFLDENKKGFAVTGPTFEIGGYGFALPSIEEDTANLSLNFTNGFITQAFSKGSPLVGKVSDEILRLRENGTLHELEKHLVSSSSESLTFGKSDEHENGILSLDGFWGLFLITGGTSTLAFMSFQLNRFRDYWHRKNNQTLPLIKAPSSRIAYIIAENELNDRDRWLNAVQLHQFGRSSSF